MHVVWNCSAGRVRILDSDAEPEATSESVPDAEQEQTSESSRAGASPGFAAKAVAAAGSVALESLCAESPSNEDGGGDETTGEEACAAVETTGEEVCAADEAADEAAGEETRAGDEAASEDAGTGDETAGEGSSGGEGESTRELEDRTLARLIPASISKNRPHYKTPRTNNHYKIDTLHKRNLRLVIFRDNLRQERVCTPTDSVTCFRLSILDPRRSVGSTCLRHCPPPRRPTPSLLFCWRPVTPSPSSDQNT